MEIDLHLFAARLAPAFGISARYVGHEPYDATTAAYNETMKRVFPGYGLRLVEIRRLERSGEKDGGERTFISATKVRAALAREDWSALRGMVPEPTFDLLCSEEGREIGARLRAAEAAPSETPHGAPATSPRLPLARAPGAKGPEQGDHP